MMRTTLLVTIVLLSASAFASGGTLRAKGGPVRLGDLSERGASYTVSGSFEMMGDVRQPLTVARGARGGINGRVLEEQGGRLMLMTDTVVTHYVQGFEHDVGYPADNWRGLRIQRAADGALTVTTVDERGKDVASFSGFSNPRHAVTTASDGVLKARGRPVALSPIVPR